MKKTEAICTFLNNKALPDLAKLYSPEMECQVNVAQDNGEKVEGEFKSKAWHGYSDGVEVWKSFRIPLNAATNPEYIDTELAFDLSAHVESIGLTGWNWEKKQSNWVGIDFDAIVGHSEAHNARLMPEDLKRIEEALSTLDYATIRRSTSGNGLHVYVFFDPPIPTENHNEHAALARAVVAQMSYDLKISLEAKADVIGNNLWIWHRKFENSNGLGLKLIKQGTSMSKAPKDWEIHLSVVQNRKNKAIKREFDNDSDQDDYEKFAEQRPSITIDDEHRKIIDALKDDSEYETYYNMEFNCLVTHTKALKKVHSALKLKGMFETASTGSTSKNCFCFPTPRGGFVIYRFGRNVAEHNSWTKETNGYVRSYFNMLPTIREASGFFGGLENTNGGFNFMRAQEAVEALALLGINITIPNEIHEHPTVITEKNDGRVIVEIDHLNKTNKVLMPDWIPKPKVWQRVFHRQTNSETDTIVQAPLYDDKIRFVISENNEEVGWTYYLYAKNEWVHYSRENCVTSLKNMGYTAEEIQEALGICLNNPWTQVNKPFQPEYIGRQWNNTKAQFKVPIKSSFTDTLYYPTWNKIFNHIGRDLNKCVLEDPWCKANGITSGADYLKVWCAFMFQKPHLRLPYLFLYSQQQHTGKSSFHQALAHLMTEGGYIKADNCLKDKFNGEIATAVLCVIEEVDLGKERGAYNKVKDWTTSHKIGIRALYENQVQIDNNTHWIQAANNLTYLPIEPGDTRIVAIEVFELEETMNDYEMHRNLQKEASDMLTELMHLELPKSLPGRMPMPVLKTMTKQKAEKKKESQLESFIREECFHVPGEVIALSDFYAKFVEYLDPSERMSWTKNRIGKELPDKFVKGRNRKDNAVYIANISFSQSQAGRKLAVDQRGYLIND